MKQYQHKRYFLVSLLTKKYFDDRIKIYFDTGTNLEGIYGYKQN
jgi:hypothetical protein